MSLIVDRLLEELKRLDRPISGDDLSAKIDLKNTRELRKVVKQAREEGYPICSLPNRGYWLADGGDEDEHAIRWLKDMGIKHFADATNIQRGMDKGEYEQLTLGC